MRRIVFLPEGPIRVLELKHEWDALLKSSGRCPCFDPFPRERRAARIEAPAARHPGPLNATVAGELEKKIALYGISGLDAKQLRSLRRPDVHELRELRSRRDGEAA